MEIELHSYSEVVRKFDFEIVEEAAARKKMDKDERIVREALVKAWIKILDYYAQPGVPIPPVEVVRQELIDKGVDAALKDLKKEHWIIGGFIKRKDIEKSVRKELEKFDLDNFLEDVYYAKDDPGLLEHLHNKVRHYVLEGNY